MPQTYTADSFPKCSVTAKVSQIEQVNCLGFHHIQNDGVNAAVLGLTERRDRVSYWSDFLLQVKLRRRKFAKVIEGSRFDGVDVRTSYYQLGYVRIADCRERVTCHPSYFTAIDGPE